jgi:hypothetical protein
VRGLSRVFAALVLAAVLFWIGASLYNAGVSAGLAEATRQAAEAGDGVVLAPYGWGGPGWNGPFVAGWGPLAFVFWTFVGIFLVIGLVRVIVGSRWGPGSGPRGWGDRRDRVEAWHRELHRRDAGERPEATAGG